MFQFKKMLKTVIPSAVAGAVCFSMIPVTGLAMDGEEKLYTTSYNTMEEAQAAAEKLTMEIASEGTVLLKNENTVLPMRNGAWISVFGVTELAMEGCGASDNVDVTVSGALANAGFNVNPTLKDYYKANYFVAANNSSVGSGNSNIGHEETIFNAQVINSFDSYNDAAVVVISRTGAEGSDASRVTSEAAGVNMLGEKDEDVHAALYGKTDEQGNTVYYKHYLMLTDSERELLKLVEEHFDKVIVLLNTSNWIETDELKFDENIDAILNIGRPGAGGMDGVAKILNGEISPSGALVDEWYSDFTADPTWYNFGSNNQTGGVTGGAGSNTYMDEDGWGGANGSPYISDSEGYHGVDYEEGIYNGYRYYETYYTDLYNYLSQPGNETLTAVIRGEEYSGTDIAQAWYERNVAYPFGYGLNYTTFSFEAGEIYIDEACTELLSDTAEFASTAAQPAEVETVYIPVAVTNTGDVAGKKTVQAYLTYDSYSDS
ncbi:MAG: glycoside hydrolase family 3 C-terminal domain-containing protein, partial [Parasporobacterium sp.]|nr:glycoside hydrolase family 3 C-terminal domain-containing protein [Parasporobacterium sp.]